MWLGLGGAGLTRWGMHGFAVIATARGGRYPHLRGSRGFLGALCLFAVRRLLVSSSAETRMKHGWLTLGFSYIFSDLFLFFFFPEAKNPQFTFVKTHIARPKIAKNKWSPQRWSLHKAGLRCKRHARSWLNSASKTHYASPKFTQKIHKIFFGTSLEIGFFLKIH